MVKICYTIVYFILNTLNEQIAVNEQRKKIQKKLDRLTKAARNEKQPKKKLELAQKINQLKKELEGLYGKNR